MGPSLSPSPVAVLSTTACEHQYQCSPDEEQEDDDGFEFTPLLPRPRPPLRGARAERPRTARHATAHACTLTQQPPSSQSARRAPNISAAKADPSPVPVPARRVRWHDMAFGSVRVPAAMDMGEIRRRAKTRQALAAGAGSEASAAPPGWAPWRLIRSLSCKGVEAVAAAAAPVRLV